MTRIGDAVALSAGPLMVAAAAFALAVGLPVADPDTWWHLASGRWMVEHRDALRVDIFTSTVTGIPYALGESIGDVILYLAYAGGSWLGVAIFRAACVALAAFAVTRAALRTATAPLAVPLAVLAVAISEPLWADGPQLFTVAFFPLLLDLLLAARAGSRASLIATVPLLFVWSALHAGYALGLALVWIVAIATLAERRTSGPLFLAAVAATLLVTLDPGALPLLRAFDHVIGVTPGIVADSPVDVLTPLGALFALLLALTLAAFLIAGADLLAATVLVPVLALALLEQRHIPLFAFAAAPFVAGALAQVRSTWKASGPIEGPREPGGWVREPSTQAVLAAALWIGALASTAIAPRQPDVNAYPVGALTALRGSTGVVLNEYDWGGYLIWSAPERPVFIDGRLFPFISDDALGGYRRAVSVLPGWRAVLDHWNVTQALLRPDRPLVQALREEGWIVRALDARAILLERPK